MTLRLLMPTIVFAQAMLSAPRFGDNYARSYNRLSDVKDSLLLFNHRDVWGSLTKLAVASFPDGYPV
jgi:hypothetical protein